MGTIAAWGLREAAMAIAVPGYHWRDPQKRRSPWRRWRRDRCFADRRRPRKGEGVAVRIRGRCIAHMGAAALRCNGAQATAGTMCQSIVGEDKGNYIPNLAVYPGKIEFTYLPSTAQALVLQPLGEAGVMLVCSDTQKG